MTLIPWTLIAVRAAMVLRWKTSSEPGSGGQAGRWGAGLPSGAFCQSSPASVGCRVCVCVCVCVCVRGGLGQEFRWHGLCALVTDPRSGVRLSGQALPGGCRAGDEVKVVLVLAQW